MPLYICRRWEGDVDGARGPEPRLGARQQAARLPDAASGHPADPVSDRFAVVSLAARGHHQVCGRAIRTPVSPAIFLAWATAARPPVVFVRRSSVSSPSSLTGASA